MKLQSNRHEFVTGGIGCASLLSLVLAFVAWYIYDLSAHWFWVSPALLALYFLVDDWRSEDPIKSEAFRQWAKETGMEVADKQDEGLRRTLANGVHKVPENWSYDGFKGIAQGSPFWLGRLDSYFSLADDPEADNFGDAIAVFALPFELDAAIHIEPKSVGAKVANLQREANINYELDEFNRVFNVTSDDRKFAFQVISQPMIEFLVAYPEAEVVIRSGIIFVNSVKEDFLSVESCSRLYQIGSGIRERIPEFCLTKAFVPPTDEAKEDEAEL